MSDALQQQYAAIERLYSQGQWPQVLAAIDAIQDELPAQAGDPLRARVVLLQGHTLLYGLGQVDQAAAIYRQVLAAEPEAVLANIAQQELARCGELLSAQAPAEAGAAFPFAAEAVGAPPAQQHADAMPWLDALGGVDPGATQRREPQASQAPWLQVAEVPAAVAADVIEEPEQIELRQADPERASVLDLEPLEEPEEPTVTATPAAAARSETATATETTEPAELEEATRPAEPEPHVGQQPRWSPAEEAELARGLLTVVLR